MAKRAELAPGAAGIAIHGRRRVKGLRREEVAMLAGISVTWYTLLEQNRSKSRPSIEVLENIGRALQMSSAEITHLLHLAGWKMPIPPVSEKVGQTGQRLLDAQTNPAYIYNRYYDILAWNEAVTQLFGQMGTMNLSERNVLYQIFVEQSSRQKTNDWDSHAAAMVSRLRAEYMYFQVDQKFVELIEQLQKASPYFRRSWQQPEVDHEMVAVKTFTLSGSGEARYEFVTLQFTPSLRLLVCLPI